LTSADISFGSGFDPSFSPLAIAGARRRCGRIINRRPRERQRHVGAHRNRIEFARQQHRETSRLADARNNLDLRTLKLIWHIEKICTSGKSGSAVVEQVFDQNDRRGSRSRLLVDERALASKRHMIP
jgi:hypothetical protein